MIRRSYYAGKVYESLFKIPKYQITKNQHKKNSVLSSLQLTMRKRKIYLQLVSSLHLTSHAKQSLEEYIALQKLGIYYEKCSKPFLRRPLMQTYSNAEEQTEERRESC